MFFSHLKNVVYIDEEVEEVEREPAEAIEDGDRREHDVGPLVESDQI